MPNTSVQAAGEAMPKEANAEHPWLKARRLGKELSATLHECDTGEWYAHVLPAGQFPEIGFGRLPAGLPEDELPVDQINRLAWELSDALNSWNGGGYQAMVLPAERGGNTVMFTNIKAWDRRAEVAAESPQDELRRLSSRMMELLKKIDPRCEMATVRDTGSSITLMTGFDVPIPGFEDTDPLFAAITDYRNATAALNGLEVPDDVTLDEENAMFDAVYGRQKDVLIEAAPIATSVAGVREAIRLALDEDSVCDMLAEGALRAALAYLDGRASA